jgi:hypothetical protein
MPNFPSSHLIKKSCLCFNPYNKSNLILINQLRLNGSIPLFPFHREDNFAITDLSIFLFFFLPFSVYKTNLYCLAY